MADPKKPLTPRVNKLIELEATGRIKPEHQQELDVYRAQGVAPKTDTIEGERKASAFLSRALGANRAYEASGVGPRGLVHDQLSEKYPDATNVLLNSPERQVSNSSQDEFIAASLRFDSGAAIPPEELERQRRIYFPSPGDVKPVIEQKRMARLRAIDGLVQASGKALTADQKQVLSAIRDDIQAAITGGAPAGAVEGETPTDQPPREETNTSGAITRVIDEAAGVYDDPNRTPDGRLRVTIQPDRITPSRRMSTDRGENGFVENADAFIRGAADTATLGFADEIAAAGQTIFGDGTMADNLRAQRNVDRYDERENPVFRGVGQLAGAVAPVGAGRIGLGARGARDLAITGGVVGSLYGAGSGETMGERFTGAAGGAAAGAAGGLVLGKLSDLYMARAARSPSSRSQEAGALKEASEDLGVDILPADAGGPTTRLLTAATAATPGGVFPVTRAARRAQTQGSEALDTIAAREGIVPPPGAEREIAGQAARDGALSWRSTSRDRIGRQYKAAEDAAGDTRVAPKAVMDALDRNIAELSEIPGGAEGLSVLSSLRDELAKRGTVKIDGIRGTRTQMRQKFMKEGLVGSDIERRVGQVLDAANEDIAASLAAAGKGEAASLYRAADAAYKARAKTLDDVVLPIIGKKGEKSGEQIADGLNAAAKGNNARLARFFEALPDDEAGIVRATLISRMGRAKAGGQNAAGDEFSFDTFLTNWNSIGQSAKNVMFRGENRKAIDQLALIAEKSKAAGKYRNYSNTGLTIMSGATAATALDSFATLGVSLGGQATAGWLLSSPKVAKALLNIAQAKTPEAVNTRIAALSQVAARDPTIRNEVLALQSRLASSLTEPLRSAATEDDPREAR